MVGRATFGSSLPVNWGIETSASWTVYDEPFLNNNASYSLGAFTVWDPDDYIHLNARAGYVIYTFVPNGFESEPDQNLYYASLTLRHRVNDTVSYYLEAGREIQLGIYSDLLDVWYVRPHADFKLIRDVGTSVHVFFEEGTEAGKSTLGLNETFTRAGAGLDLGYQLLRKLSAHAGYQYVVKDSNVADRSYHQQEVTLDLRYQF